ncbi:ABC transporter ATP-binding protein [Pontibacter sp. BT327]|uniref:ABC transporter ATP-binding protein n=2 Tax=Pontibacter burrus TaxID=2704466 RepID=A0A6B3LQH6_9BACT|nr:ABC transporter ATP-binding protein [Pontibacter burrus]
MNLLTVSDISVQESGIPILQNISFSQQEGQKIAISGETGSGKSTLLQTIAGLVQPDSGTVYLHDSLVEGPHDKLVPGHPEIAYLSQQFELPQFLRVEQVLQYSNSLTEEEAARLYEICHIQHLAKRKTNQLSGGERQRIALARLLSSWPSLLLLDEPFSNLDMGHKSTLKAVIRDISEELGITLILISHDPLDTLSWADEILVMQQGKLIQQGTPLHIYQQPVNAYAASLFGKYNLIPAEDAALFGLQNDSGKQLLLRPETIRLSPSGTIAGIVTDIHFFGSYYELAVQVGEVKLLIKSIQPDYAIGDKVFVEVGDVWWV